MREGNSKHGGRVAGGCNNSLFGKGLSGWELSAATDACYNIGLGFDDSRINVSVANPNLPARSLGSYPTATADLPVKQERGGRSNPENGALNVSQHA